MKKESRRTRTVGRRGEYKGTEDKSKKGEENVNTVDTASRFCYFSLPDCAKTQRVRGTGAGYAVRARE
jgi:hypothetical protein